MKGIKKIIGVVIVAVLLIVVVLFSAVSLNKNAKKDEATTKEAAQVVTNENATTQNADKSDDGETNFWDNISVYEETKASDKKEAPTDKNGETKTEAYPGENDGWSPIVSPDDLEEN